MILTKKKNRLNTLPSKRRKNFGFSAAGFSLIELLVVIAIMAIMVSLTLANYRHSQNQYSLAQATQKLAADLRRAQNMSMSGVGLEQKNGYGIYIGKDDTSYIIFADTSGAAYTYQASDTVTENVALPPRIKISSVSPSSGNKLHVFFLSPNPDTYFNGSLAVGGATIILQVTGDTSMSKTININKAGNIEVQ